MHSRGSEHSQGLVHVRPSLERVFEDESDALHDALDEDVADETSQRRDDGHAVSRIQPLLKTHFSKIIVFILISMFKLFEWNIWQSGLYLHQTDPLRFKSRH